MNEIHQRDGGRCARDGKPAESVHHRIHGDLSDNRTSNRLSTCGDGTRGCHGWIEAHPGAAMAMGWTVSRFAPAGQRPDTAAARVWMNFAPQGQGWYLLDDEGGANRLWDNGPDPGTVNLGTHLVTGPATAPRCELGHRLAILDGSHTEPGELAEHGGMR